MFSYNFSKEAIYRSISCGSFKLSNPLFTIFFWFKFHIQISYLVDFKQIKANATIPVIARNIFQSSRLYGLTVAIAASDGVASAGKYSS